ncbi:hypothetical protein EDB86DRAFT_814315 [Lactarius hatsudake]|nr:hypothetical protein EDB86DRAFT_814315 [Lactarius hatsudake]
MPTNDTRCNRDIPKAVKRRAGRGIWCNERTRIEPSLSIFPTEPRGDVGNGSGATVARTVRHTRDFRHETDLALFARHTVSPIEHHPSTCRHPLPTPGKMSRSVPKGIPSFDGTIRGDLRVIPYRFDSDRSNWATLFSRNDPFLKWLTPSAFLPLLPRPSGSIGLHRIYTQTEDCSLSYLLVGDWIIIVYLPPECLSGILPAHFAQRRKTHRRQIQRTLARSDC